MKNKNVFHFYSYLMHLIAGGIAFKDILDYSMLIGVGFAIIFLLAAWFSLGKKNRANNSNN